MEKLTYIELKTDLLGFITLLFSEKGLCRVLFGKHNLAKKDRYLQKNFGTFELKKEENLSLRKDLKRFLDNPYMMAEEPSVFEYDVRGSKFQKQVWRELLRIDKGKTMTYGDLAKKLKRPNSARALGNACGANPLPLFIPCHRILGRNSLGGFTGGIRIKKKLLQQEGSIVC